MNRCWNDGGFSEPVVGAVVARPGYGGIVLGPHASLSFDLQPVSRKRAELGRAWPLGPAVERPAAPPADVARALDAFFARSTGAYGVLIATPERVLCERYSEFGAVDRATPSWSMTKAITPECRRDRRFEFRLSPAQVRANLSLGERPQESPDQWRQGWIGSCGPWPIHSQPSLPPSSMISG